MPGQMVPRCDFDSADDHCNTISKHAWYVGLRSLGAISLHGVSCYLSSSMVIIIVKQWYDVSKTLRFSLNMSKVKTL